MARKDTCFLTVDSFGGKKKQSCLLFEDVKFIFLEIMSGNKEKKLFALIRVKLVLYPCLQAS